MGDYFWNTKYNIKMAGDGWAKIPEYKRSWHTALRDPVQLKYQRAREKDYASASAAEADGE